MEITKEIIKNEELFSNIDAMIKNTLEVKTIKEICNELEREVSENKGKYVNNFKLALEMGENGEKIVRKFLENLGYIFLSKCEDISHDYRFLKNGKEYVFEIKTDVAHMREDKLTKEIRDTGNIAIEYESRGKNSGIAATKADFFVTYYPHLNEIWLIKTEKLKNLIRENKETIKKVENAGDSNSNTKLFLIKRDKFKDQFRVTNVY